MYVFLAAFSGQDSDWLVRPFPASVQYQLHKSVLKCNCASRLQDMNYNVSFVVFRVTKEHRESLVKGAKVACNTAKDKLKDVQNNQLKALKKVDHVSEDLLHSVQSQVRYR